MSRNTSIEWCDATFAPWHGCTRVSPACDLCYAEHRMAHRFHKVEWGPHAPRLRAAASTWAQPPRWNLEAAPTGKRLRVFCSELADVFDNQVPDEWRADLWALIAQCPNLDWLLLTKRPQNIAQMLPAGWPWPQVWLGVTAENQIEWARRVSILRRLPAAVHFVSVEPMLEPITAVLDDIDWVICGGETDPAGKHRERLMKPEWARALLAQCRDRGVSFFMKQMTSRAPIPPDLLVREWPVAEAAR